MIAKDDPGSSINLIRERLLARGYTVREILLDDVHERDYYSFTSRSGRTWTVLTHRIGYPFPTTSAASIGRNKGSSNLFAQQVGIPIPDSRLISKGEPIDGAQQLLQTYGRIAIKPLDASLGRGLTLDITEESAIDGALQDVYEFSNKAIVQQQVFGEEVRFPVIGGKVRAALLRQTPRIVGDGQHTVAELIVQENNSRASLHMPYLTYPQLNATLISSHFLTDTTILEAGKVLELGRGTMIKTGASIYNVLDEVHPSYIADIERLGKLYGYGFVVIDMFMRDFTAPKQPDNYWFMEFNTAPVLKLFYSCRDGKMFDVLDLLIPMLDTAIAGSGTGAA